MQIEKLVQRQRQFFLTGKTLPLSFRMRALDRLEEVLTVMEGEMEQALKKDLGKSSFEAYMTELGMTLSELRYVKKHLPLWYLDRPVLTPLAQFPAVSVISSEPYGVTLIMAPWNYPILLCLEPLLGALAAGNCCILKPSAYAPESSAVISRLIRKAFPQEYVAVVEGGREENTRLLEQKFDYIFFTGGVKVGKLVMEKAAKHLTPVSLELGGKSPCIIDRTADIHLAAKRLVFGKFLNCGQTCVAPDYVLVHKSVERELLNSIRYWVRHMFGDEPLNHPDYPKMINEKHFQRVLKLLREEELVIGGGFCEETLQIEPTVLQNVRPDSPVMQEEIFGPVLPVLSYTSFSEAEQLIRSHPKPLALYLFTTNPRMMAYVKRHISFGGGCINDTIVHLASSRLPFGGVGESGMGAYHGKNSFDTFSHKKGILRKANGLDLPVRYQPYHRTKEELLRRLLK